MDRLLNCDHLLAKLCSLLFNFPQFFNFGKFNNFGLGTVRSERINADTPADIKVERLPGHVELPHIRRNETPLRQKPS